MQLKQILIGSFFIVMTASINACYYDNEEDLYGNEVTNCPTDAVKYSVQVSSILQTNCYACHSSGSNLGGILLDSYTGARNAATSGLLLGVVNHKPGFSPMPQGAPKLDDCDIEALQTWLDDGTPNN